VVALLLLLCIPVFLFRLGGYGVVSGDEAFYHGVAESMVATGDFWRVDFRGEHRPYDTFMNAPLQYWLKAVLIESFGSNYWTMRIVSAGFGIASIVLTARLVAFAGASASLFAGLVQLATFQFVYLHSARSGVLETALTFFCALAAIRFLRAVETGRGFVGHHLCLAVLLNLKLPFVLVPLLADLAFFSTDRDARRHFGRWLGVGIAVAPLALSWHLVQAFAFGEPALAVLGLMAGKGSGDVTVLERLVSNLGFYAGAFAFGAFPQVLVYPLSWFGVWRGANREERRRWRVFALYALAVVLFFTAVSKRSAWYIIPAYPFLSAAAGVWLARVWREGFTGRARFAAALALALLVWVDVRALSFNPFDPYTLPSSAAARWQELAGLSAAIGIPALAGLLVGLALALRERIGPRAVARAFVVVVLGFALVRIAAPLAHTDHQGEAERVRRVLDEAARRGTPIRFPVTVSRGSPRSAKTRFYFANEFDIVPLPAGSRPHATGYRLYRKGAATARPSSG
jgi:4-amino-4-deoxy-L-arabinose transferase-like glycosyltransferase